MSRNEGIEDFLKEVEAYLNDIEEPKVHTSLEDSITFESINEDSEKKIRTIAGNHSALVEQALDFSKDVGDRWLERESTEAESRKQLVGWLILFLAALMGAQVTLFIMLGTGYLQFSDTVAIGFFVSFTGNILGLLTIIFKYFFNERSVESLKVIKDLLVGICGHNSNFNGGRHHSNYIEHDRKK